MDPSPPISVVLGNVAPKATYRIEEAEQARAHGATESEVKDIAAQLEDAPSVLYEVDMTETLGPTVTTFTCDPSVEIAHLLNEITKSWNEHHSNEPPSYVASSDRAIEHLLAQQWNCAEGAPDAEPEEPDDEDED